MGKTPDYYEVLNITQDSSPEEIRRAYKTLAKKWHPDKHPVSSKAEAEAQFKAISEAYNKALNDQELRTTMAPTCPGINERQPLSENIKKSHCPMATVAKMKPQPPERKLECTLEELFWGCKKEVTFTRNVVTKTGFVIQKFEYHTIHVKPGWKKGTRIVFDTTGEERPDSVFVIAEKQHPFFKRAGNDLVLKVKVPLANALTGWSFSFRHLTGEKMSCSLRNEIIVPGFEKVIKGQGMPVHNKNGMRGDLRVKFQVVFPQQLSKEQRTAVLELLKDNK